MDAEMADSESILGPTPDDDQFQQAPDDPSEVHDGVDESADNDDINNDSEDIILPSQNIEKTAKGFDSGNAKFTQIPLGRVKHIMKMDPDIHMASQVRNTHIFTNNCEKIDELNAHCRCLSFMIRRRS